MLVSLTIRNVVLIDRAELHFGSGLCVLTGETGAGKSILLDSLGLALGTRANASLVRRGADGTAERAVVAAAFELDADGAVAALLTDQGIEPPAAGEPLILRRTLDGDGRSRAFINDQPVSIGLLREVGERLVEIEGQFASHGLMDPASHRAALDSFAGLDRDRERVAGLYAALRGAEEALAAARETRAAAAREEEFLRHAARELAELEPEPGEEAALAETRALLMHGEKLIEALGAAERALTDGDGIEDRIGSAMRAVAREQGKAAGRLSAVLDALERTAGGAADAIAELRRAMADAEPDPSRLERCEERLFALRAAARKHAVTVDALPALRAEFEQRLAALDDSGDRLAALEQAREAARAAYAAAAEALSAARTGAAGRLDGAVASELPPLRLDKARFRTAVERLADGDWGPAGIDRVRFDVATNPGTAPGPLARIASGGELARFLLALKVVLRRANATPTLVFDEVDSGIGGATAAAVGERLARLAAEAQVLVVTHSPQVASCGGQHMLVAKGEIRGGAVTRVDELDEAARREEIARMLAGARVTDEARAAADSLIAGGPA